MMLISIMPLRNITVGKVERGGEICVSRSKLGNEDNLYEHQFERITYLCYYRCLWSPAATSLHSHLQECVYLIIWCQWIFFLSYIHQHLVHFSIYPHVCIWRGQTSMCTLHESHVWYTVPTISQGTGWTISVVASSFAPLCKLKGIRWLWMVYVVFCVMCHPHTFVSTRLN